ncbi:UNVERIFIED_CONTAM: hypothetical protein Sradi_6827900 [Sesamum radiatum]|uniref:Uncharacterized protein n=1 Tax=Sesamum radiatum TaxID=300843 RepID=A0AAW2JVV1_SESRA
MRLNMKPSLQIETDWWKPLVDYLIEGILPANEVEATRLKSRATRFALLNGILYKHSFSQLYHRCLSMEEGRNVLKEIYEGSCGSHDWRIQDRYVEQGIQQRFTSVAYPQANWQIEITNQILVQGIKTKLAQSGGQWVDALPGVL